MSNLLVDASQFQVDDPVLGALRLDCANGYVVTSVQISAPEVRTVNRYKALADGTVNNTRFTGERVISATVVLDTRVATHQQLVDRIAPYLSPRRRPSVRWGLYGASALERAAHGCVGEGLPIALTGTKYPTVVCQWRVPGGAISGTDDTCQQITPSADIESGRTYSEDYADGRGPYPAGLGVGERLLVNNGTSVAHWTATIFGDVTNPELRVNGHSMAFDSNGGLTVAAGQTLEIDTAARTILLNGDPAEPRYDRVNYLEWTWDDVLLQPGENFIRYTGSPVGAASSVLICWASGYEA